MNCVNHPSRDAVSKCADCDDGLCIECATELSTGTLCSECVEERLSKTGRTMPEQVLIALGFLTVLGMGLYFLSNMVLPL
jgi:hypothetical protein